jgi:MFS family permease
MFSRITAVDVIDGQDAYGNDRKQESSSLQGGKGDFLEEDSFVQRRKTFYLLVAMAMTASLDMGMILPVLWQFLYLKNNDDNSAATYAFVVVAYSLGQILLSPVMAYWVDRRTSKEVLIVCSLFGLSGAMMFCLGQSDVLLGVGRFLSGVAGSIIYVSYAHVARSTNVRKAIEESGGPYGGASTAAQARSRAERHTSVSGGPSSVSVTTDSMRVLSWLTILAAVLAPSVGWMCSTSSDSTVELFSRYRTPSFLVACVYATLFVLSVVQLYTTPRFASHHRDYALSMYDSLVGRARRSFTLEKLPRETVSVLCVLFTIQYCYYLFIVAVFPYVQDVLGWSLSHSYSFYLAMGLVVLACSVSVLLVSGSVEGRYHDKLAVLALIATTAGVTFLGHFSAVSPPDNKHKEIISTLDAWQMYAAGIFLSIGFCVGNAVLPELYCRLAGAKLDAIATSMSWYFIVSSLATMLAPLSLVAIGLDDDYIGIVSVIGITLCLVTLFIVVGNPGNSNANNQRDESTQQRSARVRGRRVSSMANAQAMNKRGYSSRAYAALDED